MILDDDSSIHGAWDQRLLPFKTKHNKIETKHFTNAGDCIAYIKGLSAPNFERVLLLTDYELIKQNMNGLDVISITNVTRAILVTGHYENPDIIKRAVILNTKILPKLLASEVSLVPLEGKFYNVNRTIDLVILEDNKEFSSVLSYLYETRNKSLDAYSNTYDFLDNLDSYNKEVNICLDYDLKCPINGLEFAAILYQRGYKNLFLATGFQMKQEDLPKYITLLGDKMALLEL